MEGSDTCFKAGSSFMSSHFIVDVFWRERLLRTETHPCTLALMAWNSRKAHHQSAVDLRHISLDAVNILLHAACCTCLRWHNFFLPQLAWPQFCSLFSACGASWSARRCRRELDDWLLLRLAVECQKSGEQVASTDAVAMASPRAWGIGAGLWGHEQF